MLLHYLVKFETLKMHVKTNWAFNVNYKIAVRCIKLHGQFHEMFWQTTSCKWTIISQHVFNFKVSATSMHAWYHAVTPLVNHSVDDVLFKVKPSLYQAFWLVIDVANLCFVHALLHNTPNSIIYRAILMKLYDTFHAIFFGDIPM